MSLYQSSFSSSVAQSIFATEEDSQTNLYDNHYLLDALNKGRLTLSISPLLGCDYVFIKHSLNDILMDDENIQRTLNDIVRLLSLTPKQSILISYADISPIENPHNPFTRIEFEWRNQNAESITKTSIVQQEQSDFMDMMYHCSSPI